MGSATSTDTNYNIVDAVAVGYCAHPPQKIDDEAAADGSKSDPILACPATLGDLTDAVRSYGGVGPAALLVSYKESEKMPGTKVTECFVV